MNIVKGVVDLIRRTSGGQTESNELLETFSATIPKVRFSDVGDEAVLNELWVIHSISVDKVERRKLFHTFLKQFLYVFKDWEPIYSWQFSESASFSVSSIQHFTHIDGVVVGCYAGHPAEIIASLIDEVTQLIVALTDLSTTLASSFPSTLTITYEGIPVLECLTVVTRSIQNCRVFDYYNGIQKITALMKVAVVQLKTFSSELSSDETLSTLAVERLGILQKILVHVVSIICNFIDIDLHVNEKLQLHDDSTESSIPSHGSYSTGPHFKIRQHWQQKAIMSLIEAGGFNWLVELLHVIRRLNMKEHWTDRSLQYLILKTLLSALFENPRGQNHFRSIGGLEVLLDGVGFLSIDAFTLNHSSCVKEKRVESLFRIFELHVLSLDVLREAVFGNIISMEFLCENGRMHKFANGFCLSVFLLNEYGQHDVDIFAQDDLEIPSFDSKQGSDVEAQINESFEELVANATFFQCWNDYVEKLSGVLCSFLIREVTKSDQFQLSVVSGLNISSVYGELSVRWVVRTLLIVFPIIKSLLSRNKLQSYLRAFICILQHNVLLVFRRILLSLPLLIEVFREEGLWDFFFSILFFYFGVPLEEFSGKCVSHNGHSPVKDEGFFTCNCSNIHDGTSGNGIIQLEVVSFIEFAATFNGSTHNLPECSALLDSLEQSYCNPDVSCVLAKSLHSILWISSEKTISSFKAIDAIPRLLNVVCILARESMRTESKILSRDKDFVESVQPQHFQQTSSTTVGKFHKSMDICMKLFSEYFSLDGGAQTLVLRSSLAIDCLFDLFWDDNLRTVVLRHIRQLMMIRPSSLEDKVALLQLSSKYLETFTQLKDRETYFSELSIDLLVGMENMLVTDQMHYQTLFREGECFLHIVSLLNGNVDAHNEEKLVLNILRTLTCLLAGNDASKASFRDLVGKGYQTLQSLLLEFCQSQPNGALLNALLDMLVDGGFDLNGNSVIKNEDVILLYLGILQKSSEVLQHGGFNIFLQLLTDSISNQASCSRAGMLNLLLDWFSQADDASIIFKIVRLIQVIGGYSISGKNIRKIFSLLRNTIVGARQQFCFLLLGSISSMLSEKGPTCFFDLNGNDSGIVIKTPLQLPLNKGFTFSCWLRMENFPRCGTMGLFSFLTENGRGFMAVVSRDKLVYESMNMKRQCVAIDVTFTQKKWHYLCITHCVGRSFSGGSQLRCYLDGHLVSSERCRYAKVHDLLTNCTIGAKINFLPNKEFIPHQTNSPTSFHGQIGPIYMFSDAIASEQVQYIYSLGASYMYFFLDEESSLSSYNPLRGGVIYAKDALASKIIFGLNALGSDGKKLFNVFHLLDHGFYNNSFNATVSDCTQLCSRRLLQQIIYCVGGVSVLFPLLTMFDGFKNEETGQIGHLLQPIRKDRFTAVVIELIASVLDGSIANQQQMHLLSGFSVLGYLLQSVPPQQLNLETFSALKHLYNVVSNCGLSELFVGVAISNIFFNPLVWIYTDYKVQRELYMFLLQQFDNDPRFLNSLCQFPRVLDIIHRFYSHCPKFRYNLENQLQLSLPKDVLAEGPNIVEIRKIRLLLLSLGEMSLRQDISTVDIRTLVAFFETSQDVACIEDVLHMVIRSVSQKQLLSAFLKQVDLIGGCHIFVNLLQREYEPVRLLCLQFLGRLLAGLPSEKKGSNFFNIAVGRSRTLSQSKRKISSRIPIILSAMSERLFKFPRTELLCSTLFDVLLGGASPKQVLQKHNPTGKLGSKGKNSQFFLPQVLVLIFRFLSSCEDANARMKIIRDLLYLLDSNPSNVESLMDNGWNAWLMASTKLDVLKNYKDISRDQATVKLNEQLHVRNLYSFVLCHYMLAVKGGWQHLEDTVNFLLMSCKESGIQNQFQICDLYSDLIQRLLDLSSADNNIFITQPCRDNTLYLLRLVDEMLVSEIDHKLPYPGSCSGLFPDLIEIDKCKDLSFSFFEASQGESGNDMINRNILMSGSCITSEVVDGERWSLYDNVWVIISEMYAMGPPKMSPKALSAARFSFGQRARGLVESLNIPAAEMAAVVIGGVGNTSGGKPHRNVDKGLLLREDKCPRIFFRLVILYICKSSLERASRCVQLVISLLPCLLVTDDDQSKSRLQLFIWSLLAVRSQYGILDGGSRYHIMSKLLCEAVSSGKSMLATTNSGRDGSSDSGSNQRETGTIHNLIQKDLVIAAVADEVEYIMTSIYERSEQLHNLCITMQDNILMESNEMQAFEDDLHNSLITILASDECRRAAFQLVNCEEQQVVAEKWLHLFRTLIDERGPWSANPFPNSVIRHWKLDKSENALRQRPKLRQNFHFDEKLCCPLSDAVIVEPLIPKNAEKLNFGDHIPEQLKWVFLRGVHKSTDNGCSMPNEICTEVNRKHSFISKDHSMNPHSEMVKNISGQNIIQDRKDASFTSRCTESSEVIMTLPCILITPKRKIAGQLTIMRDVLHFFGEFVVEGTGGKSVFEHFNPSSESGLTKVDHLATPNEVYLKWPIISAGVSGERINNNNLSNLQFDVMKKCKNIKQHRRWIISKIKSVHWARYLLRYTAIEIFFDNSVAPVFLNFKSQKAAKDVGTLIVSTRNELMVMKGGNKERNGVISFVDRRVALELAEMAKERWKRRDMTNFEYLMILNTLAGRSYNDLTQYPVFPWVLSDYSSDVLDFNRSSTFRDLSKPVGALNSKRFEVFEDRYHNFSDPDIPSFYYGSHYSTMGIVLFYLLRLEPYTALHRQLQGGKFDHADRLFQSIERTYQNCHSNTSDVKELIPEFFYLPEFLTNSNSYCLGVKQDGESIDDVCLPPWAKGSPETFINRNREALESEYVSSNLHQWIDLIFGYKQRGKPAVEAANIFYYLTYEGAIDLDTIEDELQRSSIQDQIANFGQIPIQIFDKKHPRRGAPIPIVHPLYFAPDSINLTSILSSTNGMASPIIYVGLIDSNIVVVSKGLTMSVKMWLTTQVQYGGNFTFSGSQDSFFGIGSDVLSTRKIGSPLPENTELGVPSFATMQTASESFLVTCGNWENSFQILSLSDGRMVQSIRQHKDVVSCVAVTSDGSMLATGSYDTTVMVWEVSRFRSSEGKMWGTLGEVPRKGHVIIESPILILCGHDDIITCLFVSTELDIVISGSKDGTCVFHTLREGRYVRSVCHPSGSALSNLVASQSGQIVFYAHDDLCLHLYSINGKHIATSESNGRLNCVELSPCGQFLFCAGDQGQIVLRSMNSLEVIKCYNGNDMIITSLRITPEECFIAGTKDGTLLVYSIEHLQLRRGKI